MNIEQFKSIGENIVGERGNIRKMKKDIFALCTRYQNDYDTPYNVAQLCIIYRLYNTYINEGNEKIRKCMEKAIITQNSLSHISSYFNRFKLVSEDTLDDLLSGKISLYTIERIKVSDLISQPTIVNNKSISHLKDETTNVSITTESLLRQLKADTDMYVDNIAMTKQMIQQISANKNPAYKEMCNEILININNAMKSLELLIC